MHITTVVPNLLGGSLRDQISFDPNITLLSGENGTGKSKLIASIKEGKGVQTDTSEFKELRVLAISPKRNAERKTVQQALQEIRQQDKKLDRVVSQIGGQNFVDNTFVAYPSLGELYLLSWTHACRDGGDRRVHMNDTTRAFNRVIADVFSEIKLVSNWNETAGEPNLQVDKNGHQFDVTDLSCGEQEILSLAFHLHVSKEKYDVILIDEPETHLNWHLERNLFNYLRDYCQGAGPQLIVATHSRIVFHPEWIGHTRFFSWDDSRVKISKEPSGVLQERVAGEALQLVGFGDFPVATFFVEDEAQVEAITQIANLLNRKVSTVIVGNSANVRSLFKLSQEDGAWENAYFLHDGDGQGNPFPGKDEFIFLDRYCIENYLLSSAAFCYVTGWTEARFKSEIVSMIKNQKIKILSKNKYFAFLIDRLKVSDVNQAFLKNIDASELIKGLLSNAGKGRKSFVKAYFKRLYEKKQLKRVYPKDLVEAIEKSSKL